MVRPIEPPTWRMNELSPAASAIWWRGMRLSAAVVSGTNRQANAAPVMTSGTIMSVEDLAGEAVDRLAVDGEPHAAPRLRAEPVGERAGEGVGDVQDDEDRQRVARADRGEHGRQRA